MNLLWIFAAILFVVEIIVTVLCYRTKPMPPLPEYISFHVFAPTLAVCFCNTVCELAVRYLEYRRQALQPYVIVSALIIICAILLVAHSSVAVGFVVYALPVFFSLIYHSKRILRFAFLSSLFLLIAFYAGYFYVTKLPGLIANIGSLPANIAILCVAYLISGTIQNRIEEVMRALADTERAAYEAEADRNRAEAVAEAKTRLLANMSHALRTPMSGIINLSEIALDDEPVPKQQKDYLQKIKGRADKVLAVIDDVLDMTKIDIGEAVLQEIPFDLHLVLNECEAVTAQKAADKGLRLYFYNETKLSHKIIGDAARLRQVLLVFLSNAVKFAEHGSVTLVAKPDSEAVKGGVIRIIFEISDTGIGMTEEQLEKIFEPFHRADHNNAQGPSGTGLGLCIAKNIIEAMGGNIDVRSIADIGSRFSFSLEYALSNEASIPEDREAFSASQAIFDGAALLCEDDEINRQITAQNLEKLGLRVVVAENGKEGVEAACMREQQGEPFDVILMDIHMPVMDGLQAVSELAKRNIKAPVIAMTANGAAEDREKYINAGMSGYLSKPVRVRDLRACLLAHLNPVKALVETEEAPMARHAVRYDDNAAVDAVIGIENFAGSKPTYMQALDTFVNKYIQTPDLLEKAVADQDFPLAQRTAHTEKGAAAIIGAHKLSELLAVLEEAFRRDGLYFKKTMMDEYKEEHAKVLHYISELFS